MMKSIRLTTKKSKSASTFSSVADVLKALAAVKKKDCEGVVVKCAPGIYPVKEAMVFKADSVPVTFVAEKPGETIFDGGTHITQWTETEYNGRRVLCADVPASCIVDKSLPQIFINGKRRSNAPYPKNKEGLAVSDGFGKLERRDYFQLKEPLFKAEWAKDKGLQATIIHLWNESHVAVSGYDAEKNAVLFEPIVNRPLGDSSRLFLLNLKEAFTEEGEYYLDVKAKKLYYIPEKGETEIDCVIPGAFPMVLATASLEKDKIVNGINFEGIVFEYAGGGRPKFGEEYDLCQKGLPKLRNGFVKNGWVADSGSKPCDSSPQASIQLPGVLNFHGAHDCTVKDCTIRHCGWNAVQLMYGCENIVVTGCDFSDLGGGGIYIAGVRSEERQRNLETRKVTITENHIHHCGRFYLSAVGINAGLVKGALIEHNDIEDLFYSGISVGWCWGYGESPASEIRIGFNHIRNIGQGMLCDMGGIYLLGTQPGTHVYNNLIHDISCRFYGGWGLYTDEGSSYIVLENNICYDCSKESIHQHFGRENIYRFNICAFGKQVAINISDGRRTQKGYEFPGENYRFNVSCIGNVFLVDGTPFFSSWEKEHISEQMFCDLNCYWDISESSKDFAITYTRQTPDGGPEVYYKSFKEWQKFGHDTHGIFADPGFVNCNKRNFRLKKNSILKKMKFPEPAITLEQAGRSKKNASLQK